jgi:hypothetical protein
LRVSLEVVVVQRIAQAFVGAARRRAQDLWSRWSVRWV